MTYVRDWRWGGPTAAFREYGEGAIYQFVARFLDRPGETAMWNRHIDEEAIIKGLRQATGAPVEDVVLWLTKGESRTRDNHRFGHALRCWGLARFRKNYLPYYRAVRDTMGNNKEHHDVSGITGCMRLGASVDYVAQGRAYGYSWSIIKFGAENGIAMEYLGAVIVKPEPEED